MSPTEAGLRATHDEDGRPISRRLRIVRLRCLIKRRIRGAGHAIDPRATTRELATALTTLRSA